MLQVITGKPGAGKTYHAVNYLILPKIVDWCKYEEREHKPFPRKLYTNLPLDVDYIDEELCKRHKLTVKPSSYINKIDLEGEFWKKCPNGSLLCFDEVHLALGAEIEGVGSLSVAWRNYISTHRHNQHDIILLTQHIDNVTKDVLRQCEEIIDLQNIKAGRIPFFSIPLSDVYAVLKEFGYEQQTYLASYGRVVGRSIKYSGNNQTFFINKSDFGFYNTHAHGSQASSDSPELNLGRWGAVIWFIKKHLFKVFVRIGLIFAFIYLFFGFIKKMPEIMSKDSSSETSKVSKPANTAIINKGNDLSLDEISAISRPLLSDSSNTFKITAIIKNSVCFSNGEKLRVGDLVSEYDSEIVEIDSTNGTVKLENEKILYLK